MSKEGRRNWRINSWVVDTLAFVRGNHLPEFTFSSEGAFVKDQDGLWYWFDPQHATGGLIGAMQGIASEGTELGLITENIAAGSVVFDVGAGFGKYALNLAAKKNAVVYAFEPTTMTERAFRKNILRNGFGDRIHAYRSAVADAEGRAALASVFDGNYIVPGCAPGAKPLGAGWEDVPVVTIDAVIRREGIGKVDFIKIDVEGAELLVLKGADECLKQYKPYMQLEIDSRWTERFGYSPPDLLAYLKNRGYNYLYISEKENKVCKPRASESIGEQLAKGYNFFFYPESKPVPRF